MHMALITKAAIIARSPKRIVLITISIITRKQIAKSIVQFIRQHIVMGKSIIVTIINGLGSEENLPGQKIEYYFWGTSARSPF